MARALMLGLLVLLPMSGQCQRLLTLDSCRAMALRNNKQMGLAKMKQEANAYTRKSARTQYLPKVNALGGYLWMSKEISILNDDQKSALSNLGTNTATKLQDALSPLAAQLPAATQQKMGQDLSAFAGALDQVGTGIVDGFRTDTRNMMAGAVTVTQPVFMGGAIIAANKMADINEAEMALTQVKDGLALSKMLVCQLIGLPVDENIMLADEESEGLSCNQNTLSTPNSLNYDNRPELKVLQNTIDLSKQATNVLKAGNLPQVLLTGGYAMTNPNTFNGFEKKFGGVWNAAVVVRVPVWNWGDVKYKVRASKVATAMASLEMDEARELIELQVNQSNFKVNEAKKKLEMANSNVANADENLRMANLAFKEGTASLTTVMEAQTAWNQAQSQLIDAEIGLKLSEVELQKALGTLQ